MAHIDSNETDNILTAARQQARASGYVQRAQYMVLAAGLAAFGIVAVAGAMMTTLL